jgi:hypothetical protein
MSVGARANTSGSATSGSARGPRPAAEDPAGRLLGRLSVLPALLVMAWLLAGLPLLLAHHFAPVPMLVASVPLAVILVVLGLWWIPGLRWIAGRWPDALPAGAPGPARAPEQARTAEPVPTARRARTPWWAVAGVVAVAVVFGVDQMIYHTQQILVLRDPASYLNFGYWIAHHGSLPIPQSRAAFGPSRTGLSFHSPAFYQVGSTIVPQFMAGLPMILAPGFWAGGVAAAIGMGPVLGALGVLTFGGLAARLAGPRWAPLATLVLALSLPDEFTGRATYSEPVAQILFLGGLCLVIDALDRDGTAARVIGALAGLALGLTLLVRIDGASDILPVVPYIGLLLLGRRRQALPLLGGLVVGGGYGLVDGVLLTRPYLNSIKSSLDPLVLLTGLVIIATLLVIAWRWDRGLPAVGRWLPNGIAVLAFVVIAGFAIRPYVQTERAPTDPTTKSVMARFQRGNHLPVDPTRTYTELSLHWVFWYIGLPAVVLATIGVAVLSRKCLRGQAPTWTLPLIAFAWAIVTFLYRPAITPDQPWGSRRLVPSVLPGFILLAVWATGWLVGWLRRTGTGRVLRGMLAACLVVLLLGPAAITTFGLKLRSGGPVGVKVAAVGLAFKTSYQGEIGAVNGMCAAIPHGSSVLFISGGIAGNLAQVVRGMCGDPVADINHPRFTTVEQDVQSIARAGRRPVLLASSRAQLVPFGGPMRQIMDLRTTWDAHTLTTPPMNPWPLTVTVWLSEPGP